MLEIWLKTLKFKKHKHQNQNNLNKKESKSSVKYPRERSKVHIPKIEDKFEKIKDKT